MFKNILKNLGCKSWFVKPMVFFGLAVSCSGHARVIHHLNGGKIVNSVKVDQDIPGTAQGHFMVEIAPGTLIDVGGIVHQQIGSIKVGQIIDFGNGEYKVVQIKDTWEEFKINSVNDLIDNVESFSA